MNESRFGPRRWLRLCILTPVAVVTAMAFLLPIVWMVASASRPNDEIFKFLNPLSSGILVPTTLTLNSYIRLMSGSFPQALCNSIVVALAVVVIGLFVCAAAAFALSAMNYKGRNALFAVVVISFMVPFDVVAVPLSFIFRSWHLNNTYAGLVLPAIANGLAIFLLRQFFLGIPVELKDAARVDGASWFTIFWKIYVPLSRPALIGAGLMFFLFEWRSYLWPLLVVSERSKDLAPVALARYMGEFYVEYGQMFAGATVLGLIPAVVLLGFFRYFTQSISGAGIKG
jgi:putative chitobiose transport system permease protein